MAGQELSAYADMFASATSAIYGGPKDIQNDAIKRAPALAPHLDGRDTKEMFKRGKNITGSIMLDESTNSQNHLPGATFSWTNPQVLDYWTAPWRYTMSHQAIIEQEWILGGASQMDAETRYLQFKDTQFKVEMRAMTDNFNFMSGKLWAEPDFNAMEGTGAAGTEQYSKAAFMNEYANGLYNSAGSAGTAWTTVEGISPTATGNSRWTHQLVRYTTDNTTRPAVDTPDSGVVGAFDTMYRRVKYQPIRSFAEYMKQSPIDRAFISTSEKGISHYEACCRDRQDKFMTVNDPAFPGANYRGIPVQYHQELDTATLYPNHQTLASATDNVTEGNSGSTNANMGTGPRYYFENPKYLPIFFHADRYFYKRKPITPDNQPEALIVPISTWWNLCCTSRFRLGLVGPTGQAFPAYTNGS
jgi:hypothetical protein